MRRLAATTVCSFFITGAVAAEADFSKATEIHLPGLSGVASGQKPEQNVDRESAFLLILAGPVGLSLGLPVLLASPALVYASRRRESRRADHTWSNIVDDLRSSPDPVERDSIFLGRVLADGSPVLIPRSVFKSHAHFLGDSGSGKTALGLAPWLEQMAVRGDISILSMDMKADSREVYGALKKTVEKVEQESGQRIPLKFFTMVPGQATIAFNPLQQPSWRGLEPHVKADILCTAFGLNYGTDYGASWFTSANGEIAGRTINAAPDAATFRDLLAALDRIMSAKGAKKLAPDLRSAGLHFQVILRRLAQLESLNSVHGPDSEVARQAIDLGQLFREPGIVHFHLPSMLMPTVAPEIARLATYSLLTEASAQGTQRRQVYLVYDEFQRILSGNLEGILQIARSMNVGVILANQSMQDFRTRGVDLIPAIEANCRFRQWFGVSSTDDRSRIVRNSGETLEEFESVAMSTNRISRTVSQQVFPRVLRSDVIQINQIVKHDDLQTRRRQEFEAPLYQNGFAARLSTHLPRAGREGV